MARAGRSAATDAEAPSRQPEDRERRLFEQAALLERNLVLRDRETGTWWRQLSGEAVAGPARGEVLAEIPHAIVTWWQWHRGHPDTSVVLGEETRSYEPVRSLDGSR